MWISISACLMAAATVFTALYVGWRDSTPKRIVVGAVAFSAVLFLALVIRIGSLPPVKPVPLLH